MTSRRSFARSKRACAARATRSRRPRPWRRRSRFSPRTRPTPSSSISSSRTAAASRSAASCARGAPRRSSSSRSSATRRRRSRPSTPGADDYVTKPFGIEELLARLRAALRRVDAPSEPVVVLGDLRIDLEKRAVSVRGEPVQLTPHEFGAAPRPRAQPRQAPYARDAAARGVGEGLRLRGALPPRLRLATAAQARARPRAPALHPYRAGRRLSVGGAVMRSGRVAYRCSQGHLFSHGYRWWLSGVFLPRVRLGFGAYMRCPVGKHWALVRWVNVASLTEEERETLRLRVRLDDQADITLGVAIGLTLGVIGLVIALVVHSWWALRLRPIGRVRGCVFHSHTSGRDGRS